MMLKSTVRNSVAVIVIFGHLAVFIVALALGIFSILRGIDAIQTLLMASPILAVVALTAFTFVIDNQEGTTEQSKVSTLYAALCIIFPLILISIILILFFLFYLQLDKFGVEELKIALGGVETFFGVFLGAISKSLFGTSIKRTEL
jgi:hypothetical protein